MDSQMIYKWTVPVYPVNAQIAGMTLENIIIEHGSLRPSLVVEESRDENAALHMCFEWDNETAADKYRLSQAQDLIKNITVVKIGDMEPTTPIRAFISFRQDHEYIPVLRVLQTPALQKSMMDAAIKELEIFHKKYTALDSLSELLSVIDRSVQDYRRQENIIYNDFKHTGTEVKTNATTGRTVRHPLADPVRVAGEGADHQAAPQ